LIYIGQSVQREPLDRTDLMKSVDATYEAVGNRIDDAEANRWAQGSGGMQVGPGRPSLSISAWSPRESSTVRFAVDKRN
jgi:hypothetical protein